MSPEVSSYLRLELYEIFTKRKRSEDLVFLLGKRSTMWKYILTSDRFNTRQLKGMFSRKNLEGFIGLKVKIIPLFLNFPKPKRLIRHKGYRDKGTLPQSSVRAIIEECSKEQAFTDQQMLKEFYSENITEFLSLNQSWLEQMEKFEFSDDYYYDSERSIRIWKKRTQKKFF
jgi:hypothetical protein